ALKLTVAEIPDEICADDPTFKIPFSLQEGNTTGFNVAFSQKAANAGFVSRQYNRETNEEITIDIPPDVKPDYYSMKVVFEDTVFRCGDVEDSIFFKVYYKNAIIEQNWNDVIALLNKTYNGGYEFNHYQWYKNSQPIIEGQQKIEEQNSSYLYLPEGLDLNAYYRLEITRIDDNVTLFTCPIMPVQFVAESDAPVVSQQQGIVRISTAAGGYVNVWNIYGQMLYKKNLSNETELNLPIAGVYILEIMLDNGIRTVEKVVIK
ncbi:MAG: T9SS type A sorting domain-containing protein, partial [Prevotellaceae bacterium]|nr:T9SS type A sorting domain-containing protein [Prevotellaceae bacterium]